VVLGFLNVVGLGLLLGILLSFAVSKVIQQVDEPMIEITLTTIAGYGSFVLAEQLHVSGVIATVAAGMICGNYAAHTGMSPSTRVAVESFWEYLAFALNSIVFLLIGFEVRLEAMLASWEPILVAYAAVTLGRAAVIYVSRVLLHRTRERLPWSWTVVLTWGGLRGGLSMVLALGLPSGFPHRDLIVTMTFGVVVLSILVQGLTMKPLLNALGLSGRQVEREKYEARHAVLRSSQAALRMLERMSHERLAHPEILGLLRTEYETKVAGAEASIQELHLEKGELRDEEIRGVRRQLLLAQKENLLESLHRGLIGLSALEAVLKDVDAELLALESNELPLPRAGSSD
jgi:CPA1 family monovalent cation:H+ antiporter